MKLIRFLSGNNLELYGIFDPNRPDKAYIIEGDIFGLFRATSELAEINTILPPIVPPNILALGLNYRRHADETGMGYPDIPVMFIKTTNTVIGPGSPIILPKAGADEVDYEAELAVIIGKKGKNLSPDEAMDYILGYTCANDVSARNWQINRQKKQWARGKSFDTFCPLGPYIVTRDEIPDPDNLRIRAILNRKILQDSHTSDMIFVIFGLLSAILADL